LGSARHHPKLQAAITLFDASPVAAAAAAAQNSSPLGSTLQAKLESRPKKENAKMRCHNRMGTLGHLHVGDFVILCEEGQKADR
jgi:hypothetical protein